MGRYHRILLGVAALALAAVVVPTNAYELGAAKWSTNSITFYANPNNPFTSVTSAENALKGALGAWGSQSRANFRFVYGGRVNDTSTGYDNRNVTIFRGGSSGSTLASTYSWWSGNTLVDSDVIFYTGYVQLFGTDETCSGSGANIQDVAAHEYGHALGLQHSSDSTATMYGSYNACSTEQRSLAPDDIAGVEYLYPPSAAPSNTAPSVSISSPGNNSSFPDGSTINFSGSASDSQDGNLGSYLSWSSSLSGWIGSGTNFPAVLPIGAHVITASVTDSGGLTSSRQINVTVAAPAPAPPAPPPSTSPTLTARGYKVKGQRRADLSWSNLTAATIKAIRNSSQVYSGTNDGKYTDAISGKGAGTYTYQVCDSSNTVCTNAVTLSF